MSERASVVTPPKGRTDEHLLPIQDGESGGLEAESEREGCGAKPEEAQSKQQRERERESWSEIAGKVEELHTRMAE